jgi:hypothetical protein
MGKHPGDEKIETLVGMEAYRALGLEAGRRE